MDTKEIRTAIQDLNPNQEDAQGVINDLIRLINVIEDKLSELGVEHQINISLGDYGSGRYLQLEDIDDGWDERVAGEWVSSSANC